MHKQGLCHEDGTIYAIAYSMPPMTHIERGHRNAPRTLSATLTRPTLRSKRQPLFAKRIYCRPSKCILLDTVIPRVYLIGYTLEGKVLPKGNI